MSAAAAKVRLASAGEVALLREHLEASAAEALATRSADGWDAAAVDALRGPLTAMTVRRAGGAVRREGGLCSPSLSCRTASSPSCART